MTRAAHLSVPNALPLEVMAQERVPLGPDHRWPIRVTRTDNALGWLLEFESGAIAVVLAEDLYEPAKVRRAVFDQAYIVWPRLTRERLILLLAPLIVDYLDRDHP